MKMLGGDLSEGRLKASLRRYSALGVPGLAAGTSSTRRLSAFVPESVVRRLSTVSSSLGLGKPPPPENLVNQGKALCELYIRSRMRGGKLPPRVTAHWTGEGAVFPRLSHLGRHLERARPRLYAAVGRYAAPPPGLGTSPPRSPPAPGAANTRTEPPDVLYAIGEELFKSDITWGKVVSFMCVCGALAGSGRPGGAGSLELQALVEAAGAVIRGPLQAWITEHGGWVGLVEHSQPVEVEPQEVAVTSSSHLVEAMLALFVLFLIMWFLFVRGPIKWPKS